jgi:head-tail adaptor
MSFASLLVDDVTLVRPATTVDRYGNTVKDWTNATSTDVKAWISQRNATEDPGTSGTGGRQGELSDWVVYLHSDVTITAGDRIMWEGDTFEVIGKPLPGKTPRGPHHLEATVRLTTG